MGNALVLIVEDEPEIADILSTYFVREGFRTVCASDGPTGLAHQAQLKPDLVVLDIKLPGQNGHEVLAVIRQRSNVPVIMVTALAEDLDKLQALRLGADDYVVKPFNPLEVVARAQAVLRRTRRYAERQMLRVGPLSIDEEAHTVTVEGPGGQRIIDLTRTEFRLLVCLAASPNRVFERAELIDACLPEGEALERTVDSHISNLRRKLAQADADQLLIGVRGVGYKLQAHHG